MGKTKAHKSLRSKTPKQNGTSPVFFKHKKFIQMQKHRVSQWVADSVKNAAKQMIPSWRLLQRKKNPAASLKVRTGKPPCSVCDIRGRRDSQPQTVHLPRSAQDFCSFLETFATTRPHTIVHRMRLEGFYLPIQYSCRRRSLLRCEPGHSAATWG